MIKISCIVIDDEPIAVGYLGDYIRKMPQLELIGSFNRAADAYELVNQEQALIVFLDIQMPGLTGIEFLRTLHTKPAVIFTTAYSEYALEGYELDVSDYLLKPVSFERFAQAVNKVINRLNLQPVNFQNKETIQTVTPDLTRNFIFVKSGYKSVKVDLADIVFVEGMKEYIVIHTRDKKYTKLDRMKNIENQLEKQGFVRIHKSYIVSVRNINAVYGNTIEVNGDKLPLGRSYRDDVIKLLGIDE